ncbi:MAG: leucine-rich repeat protein [Bacteroidales bacterium]|nr:leucine-rich repeat protein [Bacteroidales bacterium]
MNQLRFLLVIIVSIITLNSCTDTSDLENKIDSVENRVATLEKLTSQMNTNISALQSAVIALQNKDFVTNVTEINEGSKVIGYTITFDKSGAITIYHGEDGTDGVNGKDGNTPIIGVELDSDGIYYWTLNGNWMTDFYGYKIKAQGIDGQNGTDGITPLLKIENEHWMLSVNNGATWSDLGKAKGEDGDSFFQSVTQDAHNVYIVLIDGTEITIPKKESLSILFDSSDLINISAGETKTISYTITSSAQNVNIETYEQAGWTVKLNKTTDKKGTMSITAPIPISDGKIMVVLTDNYDNCYIKTITMSGVGSYITTVNDSYVAQSLGGQFSINVNTNTEYTVLIPEEAQSWLKVDSKGPELTFSLLTNTAYDDRSTKVTLVGVDGETTYEFELAQLQKDAIVLSESNYNLSYNMQDVELVLQSNVDVVVDIPSDVTWISHIETRALTERVVSINVAENKDAASRTGNVTITDRNKNITKTIAITQHGAKTEISLSSGVATVILPRGGELNETITTNGIDDSLISTLKISGRINGTDIATIRKMSTLINLDISNASIVSGGNAYYDNSTTSDNIVGKYMFSALTNLQSVLLPTNATTIDALAFDNCTSLTDIEIPNSVLTIGVKAFLGCTSLTTIELPVNLTKISNQLFGDCKELTKVIINSNVTSIGTSAFANCTNLTEIDIPNKVTAIGSYAFLNCGNISKLTLSSNITSIGTSTFEGCGGDITINCNIRDYRGKYNGSYYYASTDGYFYRAHFKSVSFGYAVTRIGSSAFYESKLGNINLPNSITSIGEHTFAGSSVASIIIPSSVTSIEDRAFNTSSIPNIYCKPAVPPSMSNRYAFTPNQKIYVPMASLTKYKNILNWDSRWQYNIEGYNF